MRYSYIGIFNIWPISSEAPFRYFGKRSMLLQSRAADGESPPAPLQARSVLHFHDDLHSTFPAGPATKSVLMVPPLKEPPPDSFLGRELFFETVNTAGNFDSPATPPEA